MTIDSDKLEELVATTINDLGAACNAALVTTGDRLGLFRAAGEAGPFTTQELAEKAEHSLRELIMIEFKAPLRRARASDARAMAELADYASYGLAPFYWDKIKEPGQTALDAGAERAGREEGSFSYRNAIIAELDGKCAACMIGYPQEEEPEPIDYETIPAMLAPLQELENMAPETFYVNVLAAYPEARGQGLGTKLLEAAEQLAREAGKSGLSLIAEDDNVNAIRFYERFGFRKVATRPIVTEGWSTKGENWILMTKAVPAL